MVGCHCLKLSIGLLRMTYLDTSQANLSTTVMHRSAAATTTTTIITTRIPTRPCSLQAGRCSCTSTEPMWSATPARSQCSS